MWKKLPNEELHSLYLIPNRVMVVKSKRMRWGGDIARKGEGRSAFNILTGKPTTGKRHLGRHRRRWEGNIRIDIKEIGVNIKKLD